MGFFDALFGGAKVNVEKRFGLVQKMGHGSMSQVWRATDRKLGREVCLKILDIVQLDALKRRFLGRKRPSEGEMAMKMDHPNIVKTFDHGLTTKKEEFLVMEFVQGSCLNVLIESKSNQIRGRAIELLIDSGEALAYVHQKGFIHRDVNPRNLMLTTDNTIKLFDFGLTVPNTTEFRRPGNRTGTLNYMAPELLRRRTTDERIDVYSFGVMAYEILCGSLPFEPTRNVESMLRHLNNPGRDPKEANPSLDSSTARMLERGIERDPERRFQTMDEFVAALRDCQSSAA
ncbi:MAG: serine/threonine protein kinase [Planctomycetia bacterium]